MKIYFKKSWDFLAIILLSLGIVFVNSITSLETLRILLGIPFLLVFPGYSLIGLMFPTKEIFNIIQRIIISICVSIVISPSISYVLIYSGINNNYSSIMSAVVLFNVSLSLLALWRRRMVKTPFTPPEVIEMTRGLRNRFVQSNRIDRSISLFMVFSFVILIVVLMIVTFMPGPKSSFTDYYILDSQGKVDNYPHNLNSNVTGSIILGIADHENRNVKYYTEIWLINGTFSDDNIVINKMIYFDELNVTLNHIDTDSRGNITPQYESQYNFTVNLTGQYKLWFILFKDDVPPLPHAPYRYDDYANTTAVQRIYDCIDNKYQSLNLNLNITS